MKSLKFVKAIILLSIPVSFFYLMLGCTKDIKRVEKHLYTESDERWVLKKYTVNDEFNGMEFLKSLSFGLSTTNAPATFDVSVQKGSYDNAPAFYVPIEIFDNPGESFDFSFYVNTQIKKQALAFIWTIDSPWIHNNVHQIHSGQINKLNKSEMELIISTSSDSTGITKSVRSFMRFEKEFIH